MGLFVKVIQEQHELEKTIPQLYERTVWGVDTETTGLDPHKDSVILLQIGNSDIQYVIDTRRVDVQPLKPFLESLAITKVMHNGKFDYKMIKTDLGIEVENIRDTFLGEKCLCSGKKRSGFNLGAVLQSRLGIEISKDAQKSFVGHTGEFSKKQLEYAAADVLYLTDLAKEMADEMKNLNLLNTWKIENYAIQPFGDMELDGLKLDVQKWKENIQNNEKAAADLAKKMDVFSIPHVGTDLFGTGNINYGSQQQVLKLLQAMDVVVPVWENGEEVEILIPDTSDKTLKKIREGYPIVDMLKKWRSHQVRIGTFGQSYIDAIHPATGRIHPLFNQYGTETGRPAKAGDSPINPLNIPRGKEYRNAFVADPGWLVETDDYSGCELRIWAEVSEDPALMEAFQKKIDVHCMVASRLYGLEVTKKNENAWMRTPAKSMNFGRRKQLCRSKTYSIQGNLNQNDKAILSESSRNVGSVQRLTAQTERLWTGYAAA